MNKNIIKLQASFEQEPKVEKLLDLLKLKYTKHTTFFLDRIFEITATTKKQMQLKKLLEIAF